MENLKKFEGLKTRTERSGDNIITTLEAEYGISQHGAITWDGKIALADYVYQSNGLYKLVYTIVDFGGNVAGSFEEYVGVCPVLFKSPKGELYVSVTDTRTKKEQEISIPLICREDTDEPKGGREFAGDFIGNAGQCAIFHDIDIWSDKKPDRMLAIVFANGAIKKKRVVKLGFPKNNKINIHDNEIHLFGKEEENKSVYQHRQIDETGAEIKSRQIDLGEFWCSEALRLSFSGKSSLISRNEGIFYLIEIDESGNLTATQLIDIQDEIFSTFRPVQIGTDIFVTRFTTEFGNGWFVVKERALTGFYYGKGNKGYQDLLSGKNIEIGSNDLILYKAGKTRENAYATTFYENMRNSREKSKRVYLAHFEL